MVSNRKFAIGSECRLLLEEAAGKHLPFIITNKQDNNWQVYHSTFYALKMHRIIVSLPVPDVSTSQMEPAAGQEIGVSFKKGYNKFLFVTRMVAQEPYEIEPGVVAPSVTLLMPEQIEKVQRRAYNRTKVPAGERISVSFWRTGNPDQGVVWEGMLSDLSAGGIGIRIPRNLISDLVPGEPFHLQFVPLAGFEPLQVNGCFRHATELPEKGEVMLGFKLVGLEMDEGGRQTLRQISRIVTIYQRRAPISEHSQMTS